MTPKSLPDAPIVVSACLAGRRCRFDGSGAIEDEVARLVADGRAVLVCPEVDGGLSTPRPAAEIVGGDGSDVVAGRARVVTEAGIDVTDAYLKGAAHTLETARRAGAQAAILKARSPSCGAGEIYDGTFSGTRQRRRWRDRGTATRRGDRGAHRRGTHRSVTGVAFLTAKT